MLTVKHLTGLPINYLITVNFHGFKEVVDKLGGVWMDVDRRYFNKNTGALLQRLREHQPAAGLPAPDRTAGARLRPLPSHRRRPPPQRAPAAVRAGAARAGLAELLVSASCRASSASITKNIEVGEGGHPLSGDQVLQYALFAQTLPSGHLFQNRIENVQCASAVRRSSTTCSTAVDAFQNPDVTSSKNANAAALGIKVKQNDAVAGEGDRARS